MVHAALLLLMLEARNLGDLVSTISLKRSTQNLQLRKKLPTFRPQWKRGSLS
jgi:hypothetical protein